MAQVQPGARERARGRKAALQAHNHGASVGAAPPRVSIDTGGYPEPPSWREAWAAAVAVGDVSALQATPTPSLDQLCGTNAQGVPGQMFCQGGVCFCRWT